MNAKATIDIGTNSVRLLVADLSTHPARRLKSGLRITGLGSGLGATGRISEEARRKTVDAVTGFVDTARELTSDITIYGTSALRDAGNGGEVADEISTKTGLDVRVISGEKEAEITFMGVGFGHDLPENSLVIDIGGGSTEYIFGSGQKVLQARSLDLGSVRQTERHIKNDPPGEAEIESLIAEIRAMVPQGLHGRTPDQMFGVAGSITQIVALELELTEYSPELVDGYRLTREVIEKWFQTMGRLSIADRSRLPGMVPERAPTILAGCAILLVSTQIARQQFLTVSEYDSLWGGFGLSGFEQKSI